MSDDVELPEEAAIAVINILEGNMEDEGTNEEEEDYEELGANPKSFITVQTTDRIIWSDQLIKLLLNVRIRLKRDFATGVLKKKLWNKVAHEMKKHGVQILGADCAEKWKNIMKTYRKNKDKVDRSGSETITWPYFKLIDSGLDYEDYNDEEYSFSSLPEDGTVTADSKADDSKVVWSTQMIRLLLSIRLPMEERFSKCFVKKNLWNKISEDMAKHGVIISAGDCDAKWKNIMKTYRKNKERLDRTGEPVTWPYFNAVDEVLSAYGAGAAQTPPPQNLMSSLVVSSSRTISCSSGARSILKRPVGPQLQSACSSDSRSSADLTSPESPAGAMASPIMLVTKGTKKRKRDDDRVPPAWFSRYLKQQNEKETARWNKFMELEESKLKSMAALTDVLKKLVDK